MRDGHVEPPARQGRYYQGRGIAERDTFSPGLFFLRGLNDHIVWMQPVVDFLREMGDEHPVLAGERSLLMTQPEPNEQELIVDLRTGDVETQNLVSELFEGVARSAGMLYRMEGEGRSRGVSMMSSFGSAGVGGDRSQWDVGLVPKDAVAVSTLSARDHAIEQMLASDDEEFAPHELMMAILGFNEARWRKLEAHAPAFGNEEMVQVVGLAVDLARHFEMACPGSTAKRFERLSEGQRSFVLEHMAPVDRHVFTQLLGPGVARARLPKP